MRARIFILCVGTGAVADLSPPGPLGTVASHDLSPGSPLSWLTQGECHGHDSGRTGRQRLRRSVHHRIGVRRRVALNSSNVGQCSNGDSEGTCTRDSVARCCQHGAIVTSGGIPLVPGRTDSASEGDRMRGSCPSPKLHPVGTWLIDQL